MGLVLPPTSVTRNLDVFQLNCIQNVLKCMQNRHFKIMRTKKITYFCDPQLTNQNEVKNIDQSEIRKSGQLLNKKYKININHKTNACKWSKSKTLVLYNK